MIFLTLIIGIILGLLLKDKLKDWIKSFLMVKKNNYTVKFHVYFTAHPTGYKLNKIIKTDTVELDIWSKTEEDAIEIVEDIINENLRVEVESVKIK